MPWQAWMVLALLVVMFTLLIVTKLPAWVVFLGTLTVAMLLGVAPQEAFLAGFSNSGVLTVAVLFMVAAGMYRTGAITLIADRLIGRPSGVPQALRRILPPVALASAFLNNTPLVAMMIPVVRDLSRSSRLAASKLYMPLSFASVLGGATTLIGTSTNLIVAGLVATQIAGGDRVGLSPISLFTPTVVALPAAIVGLAFILIPGRRLLPDQRLSDEDAAQRRRYLSRFVVDPQGPLVGRGLEQSGLTSFAGCELLDVELLADVVEAGLDEDERWNEAIVATMRSTVGKATKALRPSVPEGDTILTGGEVLTFAGTLDAVTALWTTIGLRVAVAPVEMQEHDYSHRLVEVVLSPAGRAVGHALADLPVYYRETFRSKVVALALDGGEEGELEFERARLESGQALVLEVDPAFLYDARNESEFTLVRRLSGHRIQRTSRAPVAGAVALAMVLLAAFGVMSMLEAALLAVLAMFVTGCLSFRTALKSLEIDTIIVLAAAVGLEAAVTGSGLSAAIADLLVGIGGDNPYVALAVVFVAAVAATNIITNAAAAAFLFPVAVGMASALGISAMPLIIALMLGTSYALVNPVGYQTNLMVQKPGNYAFADFARVGLPLTVLLGIVTCVLAPIFFPFAP